MYSCCIYCAGHLGRNDAIEEFPVGRAVAFDAWKGRLWARRSSGRRGCSAIAGFASSPRTWAWPGELAELEARWREAEEIARIADAL
jgi:hypothetical protein